MIKEARLLREQLGDIAMILSLNIFDPDLMAETYRGYPQRLYGLAMPYRPDFIYSTFLGQGEDLYLHASGYGKVIGHESGQPVFSAGELGAWLRDSVLPWNYLGDIHLVAPGAALEYLEEFQSWVELHLGAEHAQRIYSLFDPGALQEAPGRHTVF